MKRLLCLTLLLLGAACRPPASGPVHLARGVPFTLRSPASGPKFFASQEVVFHGPEGPSETLLTAVENDGLKFGIVASTPLGMTLFTLQVRDGATAVDARVPLPPRFDPRLLPALIQLASWPLDEVRRGLGPGLDLVEAGNARTLLHGGKPVLTLTREGQAPPFRKVQLAIPSLGITLDIRTLEEEP